MDVRTLPALSTATQRLVAGHETPMMAWPLSIRTGADQVGDAAAGSLVVTTFPAESPATHNDGRQEIALSPFEASIALPCHAAAPPPGFVEVNAFPRLSVVAQRFAVGQDTARKLKLLVVSLPSIVTRPDQAIGPAAPAGGAAAAPATEAQAARVAIRNHLRPFCGPNASLRASRA